MKKIFAILMALSLCGIAVYAAIAASGRESKQLPPSEFEIMYATEDHAIQVKDINDVVRLKVLPDGTLALKNASGTTVWAIDAITGKPSYPPKARYANVLFHNNNANGVTDYTMSTAYDTYFIDIRYNQVVHTTPISAGYSGVSIYLPAGSAALDGAVFTIVNVTEPGNVYADTTTTTNVSGFNLVPANDVKRSSGITDHIMIPRSFYGTTATSGITYAINNGGNAWLRGVGTGSGTVVKLMYRYVAATGGTWYCLSGNTQYYYY